MKQQTLKGKQWHFDMKLRICGGSAYADQKALIAGKAPNACDFTNQARCVHEARIRAT